MKIHHNILIFCLFAFYNSYSQTELVTNGKFSSSGSWNTSSGFYYGNTYSNCNSCPGYAWASNNSGQPQTNLNAYLEQTIVVPNNSSSATLSFYVSNTLANTTSGNERLIVYVWDGSSTTTLKNIYFNISNNYTFYAASIPTSLFGKTLTLGFNAKSGSTGLTCRIDDVSVLYFNSSCTPVSIQNEPTNLTVTSGNPASFNVQVNGTSPYSYFWYKNGNFFSSSTSSNSSSNTLQINNTSILDNNTSFYCIVTNCNSSKQVTSKTVKLYVSNAKPQTPTGLSVSSTTNNSIQLIWDQTSNATQYEINYCSGNFIKTVFTNSALIENLNPSTNYSFKIAASNSSGTSDYSACVSASTLKNPGKPDLTIKNLSIDKTLYKIGQTVYFNADYINLNEDVADNISVSCWLSDNISGNTLNDVYINKFDLSAISGKSQKNLTFNITIPNASQLIGIKYLKVWIDANNIIPESDENNNLTYKSLEITSNISAQVVGFDQNGVYHLMWPFYNQNSNGMNGKFNPSKYWSNQKLDEVRTDDWYYTTHTGHNGKDLYAQDWNFAGNGNHDCELHFYSPIEGNVIVIRNWCGEDCDGSISSDTCGAGYGNSVMIQSSKNPDVVFVVAHLTRINPNLKKGPVKYFDYIGDMGMTGSGDGSHFHCFLNKDLTQNQINSIKLSQTYGILTASNACEFLFDAIEGGGGSTNINSVQASFILYPNPINSSFMTVKTNQIIDLTQIAMTNSLGQILELSFEIVNDYQIIVDVSNYSNGIYFIKIGDEHKKVLIDR